MQDYYNRIKNNDELLAFINNSSFLFLFDKSAFL